MSDLPYVKGNEYTIADKPKKSKKCFWFTVLNLTISTVTCGLLLMVLNSREPVCVDDDMIISNDASPKMAVRALVFDVKEGSGAENIDDDELSSPKFDLSAPFTPYNATLSMRLGVDYALIVNDRMPMQAHEFVTGQWDSSSDNFKQYGKRYLKKSGMYEYSLADSTNGTTTYKYKVKMSSMIGPDHADQEQIIEILEKNPRHHVLRVTIKTQNFPYSDSFNLEQIWVMENVDDSNMRLEVYSGIDWVNPPNFMIKGFIESDLEGSQKKMGKTLYSIYPFHKQL